jgi:hypothetical protein
MNQHPGIRIDRIAVDGVGGLIFAARIVVLAWLAVPALRPLMAGCALGGLVFAPIFHRGHP